MQKMKEREEQERVKSQERMKVKAAEIAQRDQQAKEKKAQIMMKLEEIQTAKTQQILEL